MELKDLRRDKATIESGEEVELVTLPGVFVRIRSNQYPPYRRLLSKLTQPETRKVMRNAPMDPIAMEAAEGKAIAKELLVEITRGVEVDGEPVHSDPALFEEMLTSIEYKDFFYGCRTAAEEVGRRRTEDRDEVVKN